MRFNPPPGWQLWMSADQGQDTSSESAPGDVAYGAQSSAGSPWDAQPAAGPAGYTMPRASAWGPPATPPPSGTSGMAIAAFVLGLLGGAVITAILGIVVGIVALSRIRRTGKGGEGFAIAGIVLSVAWLALPVVLGALVAVSTGSTPPTRIPAPASPSPSARATPGPMP